MARAAVLGGLMLAAFTFNTAENLPVGLLELISESLGVSLPAVGFLVTGYGVTVAVASVPLAHAVRAVPRRHVLTGVLAALVVSSLVAALATQGVGMLGLYAAGAHQVAVVVFLVLMGGALGPVFMATQNAMLHCAPGRTDIALAANSGAYNAGIAAGAALGGLILSFDEARTAFLAGGLLTVTAWTVLLVGARCVADPRQ